MQVHSLSPRGRRGRAARPPRQIIIAGRRAWLVLLALGVVAFAPATATATVSAVAGVTLPASMIVGQTAVPASVSMTNRATGPDAFYPYVACNASDAGSPCFSRGAELVLSCKPQADGTCSPQSADPGVMTASPTGLGAGACAGTVFDIALTDAFYGTYTLTPRGGARVHLPLEVACRVDFTIDVLHMPTDQDPTTLGNQAIAVTSHRQCRTACAPGSLSASGWGTARSTVRPAPPTPCTATGAIVGTAGNDTLVGTTGDDVICGMGGNDVLYGQGGNDTLDGGLGADALWGGSGADAANYSSRSNGVEVTLDGEARDGQPGEGDNVQADVENVIGGAGNDTVTGDAQANTLIGNDGDDALTGWPGNDTLDGGSGDDTLRGAAGNDLVRGGDDDDTLYPGFGTDDLKGGAGTDRAEYSGYGAVNVSIDDIANDGYEGKLDNVRTDVEDVVGSAGNDTITGSAQANTLIGNGGDDALTGLQGNDTLEGGAGSDVLRGAADNDAVRGGDGDDTLFPGFGTDDVLEGGGGTDLADYSGYGAAGVSLDDVANDGSDTEHDNVHSDVENVLGSAGNDTITGSSDANVLTGGAGDDYIAGRDGDDVLIGGSGRDVVRAEGGDDTVDVLDGSPFDYVLCGSGLDGYASDDGDTIGADCEFRAPGAK